MQLSMLLLLQLLLLPALVFGEEAPPIDTYFGDRLIRVNFTTVTTVDLSCPDNSGFIGISRKPAEDFVTKSRQYTVDLRYTKGDYESLQTVREKLGPYHCLYRADGKVRAYAILLSEKPQKVPLPQVSFLKTAGATSRVEQTCRLTGDDVIWERYQDGTGLFVPHPTSGSTIVFDFTVLQREQSAGFTIYRCFRRSQPEMIAYYEARKPTNLEIRTFQTSHYVSPLLPKFVRPEGVISLECHGQRLTDRNVEMYFKSRDSSGPYQRINCTAYPSISCIVSDLQTQLKISPFQPKHIGDYYCVKDNVIQRAKLQVDPGDVIIKEYTKGNYSMGEDNTIRCMSSEKSMGPKLRYVLKMRNNTQLVIKPGETVQGFTASLDKDNELLLNFPLKMEAVGARLECHLHFKIDYINIVFSPPKLSVTARKISDAFGEVICEKDPITAEGEVKISTLLNNGSLGQSWDVNKAGGKVTAYPKLTDSYTRFVCHLDYKGLPIRSNIVGVGKLPTSLNIFVEGDKNPPAKVYLNGRDIVFHCSFEMLQPNTEPLPDRVTLLKNGSAPRPDLERQQVNTTSFRFVLLRASPYDSGFYKCDYQINAIIRANPLSLNLSSPDSRISICTRDQFVCDSTCKDRSQLCDGKKDCTDGNDEDPRVCDKCEPNSVKCEINNGTQPKKGCVLKHWLCDGQDDCGNNFDENLDLHRKWCFKEGDCTGCQPFETCCPFNKSLCIRRAYECDNETDCSPRTEEDPKCMTNDCLEITTPDSRTVIEKKVGDPLELNCVAKGTERPTINWRLNWAAVIGGVSEDNAVLSRTAANEYVVQSKLKSDSVTKAMAGIYNCEAINNCKRILSYEIELKVSD